MQYCNVLSNAVLYPIFTFAFNTFEIDIIQYTKGFKTFFYYYYYKDASLIQR